MQKLGFTPQRNISPAFGCKSDPACKACDEVKKMLINAGVWDVIADGFIKENSTTGFFTKKHDINKAAKLLDYVKNNLKEVVEALKRPTVN
jgi:hypothetical protein